MTSTRPFIETTHIKHTVAEAGSLPYGTDTLEYAEMGTDKYDKLSPLGLFLEIESRFEVGEIDSLKAYGKLLAMAKHFEVLEQMIENAAFFENVIRIC